MISFSEERSLASANPCAHKLRDILCAPTRVSYLVAIVIWTTNPNYSEKTDKDIV